MGFLYPRPYPRQSPGYPPTCAYSGSGSGGGLAGLTAPRDEAGTSTAIKVAVGAAGVAVIVAGLAYLLGRKA